MVVSSVMNELMRHKMKNVQAMSAGKQLSISEVERKYSKVCLIITSFIWTFSTLLNNVMIIIYNKNQRFNLL